MSTKTDLLEYGIDDHKIRVIPEANNISKASWESVEQVKKKYKIFGDYVISVGSSIYKNIPAAIEAFNISSAGKNLKMVVIGGKPDNFKNERNVRFLGFVGDLDYSALCTGAKAVIFPSLYEGFGIPILNGFACETPVVTSNISSMPEVAGDGAVLVDPTDIRSIAKGIEEALNKPKTYIRKGLKQLSKFSWKKTAEETLRVYENFK